MQNWFLKKYRLKNMEEAIKFCGYLSSYVSGYPDIVEEMIDKIAKEKGILTCQECSSLYATTDKPCSSCDYCKIEDSQMKLIYADIYKFVLENFSLINDFYEKGEITFDECLNEAIGYASFIELLNYYNSLDDKEKKIMDGVFYRIFALEFNAMVTDILYKMLGDKVKEELKEKARLDNEKARLKQNS